jgi:hypothetical protein
MTGGGAFTWMLPFVPAHAAQPAKDPDLLYDSRSLSHCDYACQDYYTLAGICGSTGISSVVKGSGSRSGAGLPRVALGGAATVRGLIVRPPE